MPSKQSLLSHHELNFLFVDWVDFFLFTFKSFQLMRIYLSSSCFCGVHWKIRCLCSSVSFFCCCCVVCFSSLACLLLSNRISNSSNSSKWYFEYEGKWTVSKTLAHTHTHIQLRNNNTLTERVYDSWWCEQCKTHRHWIRIGMICFWFFFFTFFRSLLFFFGRKWVAVYMYVFWHDRNDSNVVRIHRCSAGARCVWMYANFARDKSKYVYKRNGATVKRWE